MVAHDGRVQIVLEQFHHIDGIRARPPQKCRSLKGARACAHGKLLRIEHDTGKKRLRLNRANVPLVDSVLQKLCHKFGGRRRERLMEVQNDLLNVICRPSVVVDDGHAGNGLQQCARLNLIGPVRIDDNEQALRVCRHERVFARNECTGKIGRSLELGKQAPRGVLFQVHDDLRRFSAFAAQAADTDRRAQCI